MKKLILRIAIMGFLGIGVLNAQDVLLVKYNNSSEVVDHKNPKKSNLQTNLMRMKQLNSFDAFKAKKVAKIAREMDLLIQKSERTLKKPYIYNKGI